jgi:hypothetical protein
MWTVILGLLGLFLALLIGIHHLLISGRWVDLGEVLHHVFCIALTGGIGLGILLGQRFAE